LASEIRRILPKQPIVGNEKATRRGFWGLNKSTVSPSIKRLSTMVNAEILYNFGDTGVYKVKA
jgi:hypothetical protein